MSLLEKIGFGGKPKVNKHGSFSITRKGSAKLQNLSGDTRTRILMALETRGSSQSLDDIAEASGVSRGQVEKLMQTLVAGGYVRDIEDEASAEDDDGDGMDDN
jgi:hypothetical protein